jgi:hypothetical protein
MDDFQHRLLVALERLAGRGDSPTLDARFEELDGRLDMLADRLLALIAVQEAILDKMPGPP